MRYEEATEEIYNLLNDIIKQHFSELVNCKIKILMDSNQKKNKGKTVFGRVKKSSEVEKYLTADNVSDGYDFFMFLDANVFANIVKEDKERIIRHELRHILFNPDAKQPYKIIDHDIEDFLIEIKLNRNDPKWIDRVTEISNSIYEKD